MPVPLSLRAARTTYTPMSTDLFDRQIAEIRALIGERLRVRGSSFSAQVQRVNHRLPRRLRKHAAYLVEAQKLAENPKLARMINAAEVKRAHRDITRHLRSVDPGKERADRWLGVLGIIALYILMFAAATIAYLVWSGRV